MSQSYDRDPYAILGIHPTATASQVKEAYHRLARQHHPDLNKDPAAIERMKDINWAYGILGDTHERSLYDLWRTSSVRVVNYPGTDYTSYPSTEGPADTSPASSPARRTAYSYDRATQSQRTLGCSMAWIIWLIMMILINLVRARQLATPPSLSLPDENMATRTARMGGMISVMQTAQAAQQPSSTSDMTATLYTPDEMLSTPSPMSTALKDDPGQNDSRSSIVPGSWVWQHLNNYFPELTTPTGLSDEVTLVTYDELKGYHIITRNLGDYWLYISPGTNAVSAVHFPPSATPTPLY